MKISPKKDVDRKEIISSFLQRKRFLKKDLSIKCHHITGFLFRDVLDLYLAFSGAKNWEWAASNGNTEPRQSLPKILSNLFANFWSWPFNYAKKLIEVNTLLKMATPCKSLKDSSSILYLRTDHWFDTKSGGALAHVVGVNSAFCSLEHHVHVVSTEYLPGLDSKNFQLCEPKYLKQRNIPNMGELNYNNQLISFIEDTWNENKPSFIYQRYSLFNYTGVHLKQKFDIPFVCEYNGSLPWIARNWRNQPIFHEKLAYRVEFLNMQAADVVVVVSEVLKNDLIKQGIDPEKILVNPMGVDPASYSPNIEGAEIRDKYHLQGKIVIGFIGSFGGYHGVEVLVQSFKELITEFPEYKDRIRLMLIGDGDVWRDIKKYIDENNLSQTVILTGSVAQEEGPSHLAACDILTSPFLPNSDGTPFFGSPIKLFEYMAMGKAIVSSNLGQISDIIEQDETGVLLKAGDVKSLKMSLKNLIDDPSLRSRLGNSARKEVLSKFTWEKHTSKILEKLQERCGNH